MRAKSVSPEYPPTIPEFDTERAAVWGRSRRSCSPVHGRRSHVIPAFYFLFLSSVINPIFTGVSIQLTDSFTLACENGYMDGQAGFSEEAKTMTVTSLGTKLTLKDWDQSDDHEERK